jgi:hypothetical protein
LRAIFTNLSYDAPVGVKIKMFVGNVAVRLRGHSSCCGHPGQPGC